MLKKKYRLTTKKDFDYIFQNGKKFYTDNFLIIITFQKRENLPKYFKLPRFGFIASKKVGKATDRNRAKRLLREAVRLNFSKFTKNFEAILIAKDTTPTSNIAKIQKDLLEIAKKAQILKTTSQNEQMLD